MTSRHSIPKEASQGYFARPHSFRLQTNSKQTAASPIAQLHRRSETPEEGQRTSRHTRFFHDITPSPQHHTHPRSCTHKQWRHAVDLDKETMDARGERCSRLVMEVCSWEGWSMYDGAAAEQQRMASSFGSSQKPKNTPNFQPSLRSTLGPHISAPDFRQS